MPVHHPRCAAPPRPRRATRRGTPLLVLLLLAAVMTAAAPSIVRVRPGDTLWEIAQRHHTSVSILSRLNALRGATIHPGQRLQVPGSSAPTPTSAYNAGVRIPMSVRSAVVRHRAVLQSRRQPSHAQVRAMIERTARRHHLDPALALAVAWNESGFQQAVVSPVDAIGIMQVLPSTGRLLDRGAGRHLDLLDAQDNVTAGVMLLSDLSRSTGSARMTLAGYYQGLGSVRTVGMLPQTYDYIRTVSILRARFTRG